MILYNLFPLLAGPFSRWERDFSRASAMGFDWVFINPIQQPGTSGSLYSISDYFAINPILLDGGGGAADDQVRAMVATARRHGLRVMIDLVINHCAVDSPLTRDHPAWFVHEPDGRIRNPSCGHNGETLVWRDLAQLDHRQTSDPEGLYLFFRRVVEHLVSLGFEGFRCDAAYQIPPDFWRRLIGDLKSRQPRLCFVAETLGCPPARTRETAQAGFDYVFNSSKWWDFQGDWLLEGYNLVREVAPSISFPESHDTARLADELNGNLAGLKQRYLFSALFSTGVMIPAGFEFGNRKSLHVIHTTPGDWAQNGTDLCAFITQVNALKQRHPVFGEEGPTRFVPCHNPNVLLMHKSANRQRSDALLILNRDTWNHQEFYCDHLRHLLPAGVPLRDVSPEYPLAQVHEPFHYALRPGQGIVLVASPN